MRTRRKPASFARRWTVAAFAAIALAAALLAAPWTPGLRPRDLLLAKWRQEIESAADEQAPLLLSRIGALGDVGLPILVDAVGNPRDAVSRAAEQEIFRKLDLWRWEQAAESSPKIALLADELSRRATVWPPSRQAAAARLAERLLTWPVDNGVVDESQLIANCERVLRSVNPSTSINALADIAEGQLGVAETQTAAAPSENSTGDGAVAADQDNTPRQPAAKEPLLLPETVSNTQQQAAARNTPPASSDSLRPVAPPFSWSNLSHREVMERLYASELEVARAAENELRRRGFTTLHIRLAYRLVHPDVRIRRQFTEDLPRLEGVDARPWLLWLSDDDAADVRSLAASILATSQDPRLHKQLEEVTRNESSPVVRERLDQYYQAQRGLAEERDVR